MQDKFFFAYSTGTVAHRHGSFAPVRWGEAQYFVDGCDYMAAVGEAINKV